MKIADNTIKATEKYLHDTLKDIFNEREITSLADILFEDLLGVSKTERVLNSDKRLSESELLQIIYACKDLKKQIPVQHITGKSFFMDLVLEVNKNVLIPRPETEELVSVVVRENKNPLKIIDFCTGSGCIALALKQAFPKAEVNAIDVSEAALEVAKINAEKNKLEVKFLKEDVLATLNFEHLTLNCDIIISNPPYVLESDKLQMSPNVLNHEPHLALFVPDEDALKFYKSITEKSAHILKKGGKLYFEIHEEKGKEVAELLVKNGFSEVRILKDMYEKDRFVSGIK
ncbi:MAG: peptide chain release factor N(5)-glutamine methyltransferase [Bacteroidetes bacterium]|nr:peptide chain release factor N(5)-glutamine methyltransferase [Bacteroidota bacterium]